MMYTETELREALEHSATRADALVDHVTTARRKHHLLPALAAAAVIVSVVAGGVALQGRSTGRDSQQPSVRHTHAPAPAHVPVDVSDTIDQMRAGDPRAFYLMGNNVPARTETITKQLLPSRSLLTVTLVDSSALDPARIPRDRPVPIAGTTGYFSKFKLYPLDGGPSPYHPIWTIAFQDPAGKWVFVRIDNALNGIDHPAEIAAEYAKLHIDFVNGQTRLPFRTGYVPRGYRLESLQLGNHIVEASLTNGDIRIAIDVTQRPRPNPGCVTARSIPIIPECRVYRRIGDYTIFVTTRRVRALNGSQNADSRLAARVFDSLTIAPTLGDPATYWTIAGALG